MNSRRLLSLAWKSLWQHKLRSLLTVLGIVFGVSSVVAMLAIGEGASQEAQEQIRRLGSRNLLLASIKPPQAEDAGEARTRLLRYGLLRRLWRLVEPPEPFGSTVFKTAALLGLSMPSPLCG